MKKELLYSNALPFTFYDEPHRDYNYHKEYSFQPPMAAYMTLRWRVTTETKVTTETTPHKQHNANILMGLKQQAP